MRLFLSAAVLISSFIAPSSARADEVDDAFKRANEALREGRFAEAEADYEIVFKARPGADVAANLAQAEIRLGKKDEAAQHLHWGIKNRHVTVKPEQLAAMEEMLAECKREVAAITVEVNVPGAGVFISGRSVGDSPLADPVFVVPGFHTVRAEKKGYVTAEGSVQTAAGGDHKVVFEMKEEGGKVEPDERPIWPAILLGGVGGALVATGIGTIAGAYVTRSDIRDRAAADDCMPETEACASLYAADIDRANILRDVGIVGLSVGGAALLGMVVYFIAAPAPAKAPAVTITPLVSPELGGVVFSSSF